MLVAPRPPRCCRPPHPQQPRRHLRRRHRHKILANSRGFIGDYRRSFCSISAVPIAQSTTARCSAITGTLARALLRPRIAESIGAEAARRTLRRLDARCVPTQHVPIVFAPEMARLIGNIFEAANGRHLSPLLLLRRPTRRAGRRPQLTIIDDGTLVGGFGTSPFDGEGLPTRRTAIVQRGVLKSYLLNTYTAASSIWDHRQRFSWITGAPGIGGGNLFLEWTRSAAGIILDGIQVRPLRHRADRPGRQHGHRRLLAVRSGLWIENGELSYPVEGITIAGNLQEMFRNITAFGDDMVFRSSVASPTLRIDGMTIANAESKKTASLERSRKAARSKTCSLSHTGLRSVVPARDSLDPNQ